MDSWMMAVELNLFIVTWIHLTASLTRMEKVEQYSHKVFACRLPPDISGDEITGSEIKNVMDFRGRKHGEAAVDRMHTGSDARRTMTTHHPCAVTLDPDRKFREERGSCKVKVGSVPERPCADRSAAGGLWANFPRVSGPRRLPAQSVSQRAAGPEMMTEELDVSGQDSDGGSEEVVLTPAELIDRLEQAWMNEKFAPELLETKSEIVECVIEQLDHMEENLRRAKKGDLKVSIHQMEMERIRYVLSSYLRCRLMKIEKFFPHILEKEKTRGEGEPSSLSPEEFAFAKEYMTNTETYLKNVALKHMPPNLQKVDLLKAVPKPDLDSYVFLRVKERQENLLVEPETDEQRDYVIDLEEGSQHLIRYKTIAPLVASGAVQLI
ncbi:DNA replication complex GINS protein SLD5 [Camelus dromedarius]|uniref:DNA replication complex GINS protein SLD5 n=3 Tax=Camelus TaxID=9836 RepID=A0A5N4CFP3_CAMDR|nr:DNA replication complex GINS protein SLD5 [Camelus dromedarius]